MIKNSNTIKQWLISIGSMIALVFFTTASSAQSVSIAASANPICSGTFVTFSATPSGAPTPVFAWYLNGAFTGQTGYTYSNPSLSNGNNIVCYMFYGGFNYASNTITMTVGSLNNYYLDADGDGFGAGSPVSACSPPSASYVTNNLDCNDSNFNIKPTATEIRCNGIDENCNGMADDTGPEINLFGLSVPIADGSTAVSTTDNTDYGNVAVGSYSDHAFQITNTGSQVLTISAISATNNAEFNANVNGYTFPVSVGVGNTLNVVVRYTPSAAGISTTTLNILSNDCDESPYNFNLQGGAPCTPPSAAITSSVVNGGNSCQYAGINLSVPTVSGGSYAWSGNGIASSTSASTIVNPSASGIETYSVTVSTSATCTASASVSFNILPTPTISSMFVGSGAVCPGNNVNLGVTSNATSPTFSWSGDGVNNVNLSTTLANPTTPGTSIFTVTVTESNGCTATGATNTLVYTPPTVTLTPTPNPVCVGATLNLAATAGGLSYNWAGNGIVTTSANTTTAVPTIAGNQVYSVTINDNNSCTATTSSSVTVNAGTNTTITLSACGSYTWAANGTTYTTSGTYTNTTACGTETLNLTINPTPTAGITGTTTACDSTIITGTGGTSYAWSNGTNTAANTVSTSGTYTVTVTDAAGCTAATNANVTITPSTTNTTTISACGAYAWAVSGLSYNTSGTYTSVSGCNTEILNLTINPVLTNTTYAGSACDSYTWGANGQTYTTSGTYTYIVGCTTSTLNLTVTPSSTNTTTASACGSYTWSVNGQTYTTSGTYNYYSGCHTEVLNLTINPTPTAGITGATTACGSTTITGTGGTSYVWSNGANTAANTVSTSGTYTVTVTDATGCTAATSANITINTAPTAGITGTTTGCTNVSLTATGGTSYVWSGGSTPNAASNTFNTSGTYTVTVTNAAGCTAATNATVTIGVATTNTTTTSACNTYTWAVNGLTYTTSGTYTSVSGCNTEVLNLTINTSTPPTVNPTSLTVNAGQYTTLFANSAGTFVWYNASNVQVGTGATFVTPLLMNSTTYSVVNTAAACPTATVIPITVTTTPTFSGRKKN